MKTKMKLKLATDLLMTAALLLLMAYELIGQAVHEWIGIGIFALFVLHHILNSNWSKNILKGRYTGWRMLQTVLVALILLCMSGSMVSGVILSRHVFSFLSIHGGRAFARVLHMLSAYWGFVFMSLHLGIHWNMLMGLAGRFVKEPSEIRKWGIRAAALLIAGYGIYAFMKRDIAGYMFLQIQFVYFDFEEPVWFFLLDYLASGALFVCFGHYLGQLVRRKR